MAAGVAIAALVVAAFSAKEQHDANAEASKQRKRANTVSTNRQRIQDRMATRQRIREERVRRAQIQQVAENTGTSQSSSEAGAVGALQTNLAIQTAFTQGEERSANAISYNLQRATDAEVRADKWAGIGGVANSVFGMTGGSLSKTGGTTNTKSGG